MALVLRSWLAIMAVFSGARGEAASECAEDAGGDVVGLLQKGSTTRHLMADVQSFGPAWKSLENLLDTTLADLVEFDTELTRDGDGGSDAGAPIDWPGVQNVARRVFDRAINGSDVITPRMRNQLLHNEAQKSCKNLTKGDLRRALALIADLRPKLTPYLLKYNDIVVFAAWTGRRPPSDSPEPTHEERTTPAALSPSFVAVNETNLSPCTVAIIGVVPSVISLFLNVVGLDLPSGLINSLIKAISSRLGHISKAGVNMALETLSRGYKAGKMDALTFAVKFVQALWDGDILLDALEEAFDSLSWWDYTMIAVPAIATIASYFLTFGAAAILNVGVGTFELTMAIAKMTANCAAGADWL